jgi:hypothetical protein
VSPVNLPAALAKLPAALAKLPAAYEADLAECERAARLPSETARREACPEMSDEKHDALRTTAIRYAAAAVEGLDTAGGAGIDLETAAIRLRAQAR